MREATFVRNLVDIFPECILKFCTEWFPERGRETKGKADTPIIRIVLPWHPALKKEMTGVVDCLNHEVARLAELRVKPRFLVAWAAGGKHLQHVLRTCML